MAQFAYILLFITSTILMLDNSYRYHDWDEENRLRFVLGENYAGYYGYDAAGERVYKLMGTCAISQMNGSHPTAQVNFEELTLYPNPYIVISPHGYTKHYYAGSERIATVIGGGGLGYLETTIQTINPIEQSINDQFYKYYSDKYPFGTPAADTYQYAHHEDIDGHNMADLANACEPEDLISLDMSAKCDLLFDILDIYQHLQNKEQDVYYYHGDHLGSASWITDNTGAPIQYMHYAPFGELVANQKNTTYDERYKFTGKERDEESGYDYYGARFYWHLLGIWLSVDPLVDKYLWINPYAFCAWNPVKYVDPNGKQIGIKGEDGEVYIYQEQNNQTGFYHNGDRLNCDYANAVTISIDKIKSGGLYGRTMVEALEQDERMVFIKDAPKNRISPSGHYLYWNPTITNGGPDINDNTGRPAFIGLAHEFAHILSRWNNFCDFNKWCIGMADFNPTKDEIWATYMENQVRIENMIPIRKYYAQNGEDWVGCVWGRRGPLYPEQFAHFVGIYMKVNGR